MLLAVFVAAAAWAQDPTGIVRKAIVQSQLDWVRMNDYAWQVRSVERHFDPQGNIESVKRERWETLMLGGEPHRRTLERDGKPVSAGERRRDRNDFEQAANRLSVASPAERQRRMKDAEARRGRDFAFLSEIPDLFDLRMEGESVIEGRPCWVIYGTPRPGAQPRSRDGSMLLKARGRMWIDKATGQWAKVEMETTDTISWGLILARIDPGAKVTLEQMPVTSDLWFPKRLFMAGSGRIGLIKRLAEDQEFQWSDYRRSEPDSGPIFGILPGTNN
jgi:hypothetical protein